jgi:PAS domain S-box-containing protein
MLLDLIQNLALLVALSVGLQMIARRLDHRRTIYGLTVGLMFGAVCVLGMKTPIHFAEGVIYDGRSIILALAGLFGGPISALVAALIAGAFRASLGGAGVYAGVGVVLESAILGTVLYYLRRKDERWVGSIRLLAFGLLVHVVMLALQLLIPGKVGLQVLRELGPVILVLYPLGFLLTALIFLEGERKRESDETLRQSEERYRSLFENNHAVMLLVDSGDGAVVDANLAACVFYGWSRNQMRAMNITDINTLSREEIQEEMAQAKKAKRNQFYFRHRLASGLIRDVEVFSGPIQFEGRALLYSIIHDITERKEAEERLTHSEDRFRRAVEEAPFPIMIHAEDGRVLAISRAWREITGYSNEQLSSIKEWTMLAYGPKSESVRATIAKTYSCASPAREGEFEVWCGDGSIRIWDFSSTPLGALPDGNRVVISMAADVTEHKRAERRVERLNQVLLAIRDVNQLIVRERDQASLIQEACRLLVERRSYNTALIILTDDKDKPVEWAEAGLNRAVSPLREMLESGDLPPCCEKARQEFSPVLISDRNAVCVACPVIQDCEETDTLCVQLRHDNEPQGYLAVSLAHTLGLDPEERGLFDEMASDLAYAMSAIADRNARSKAELDREDMQRQLLHAQKMEAVGQLAGGVVHDFNNILQAIIGYTQLLMDTEEEKGAPGEELKEIFRGAERAAALTRQLLAFSRRQVMSPRTLDLNILIEDILKMLRRVIGEHIRLEWLPGNHLGAVRADPGMLEQILMNLCVNARDAMPRGGVLSIETQNVRVDSEYCEHHAWARPGRFVLLSVTDTGCGMGRDVMDRVFEPFFTTKEEGKGTGLGLATVYGIVKQHEGMVNVYSEVGKGTTFKVYLPMCEQMAETIGTMVEGPAVGGRETILLAEDDEMVRNLARRILTRAGYTVLTANDGLEAVEVFQNHAEAVSLLVLDVVMPRLGGHGAYERIREIRSDVPVIFSSGYSENAVHTNFVLHDGLKLIPKPYSPATLLRAVRGALDNNERTTGMAFTS